MYRQGDILLVRNARSMYSSDFSLISDGIIAHGELTGHSHILRGDGKVYRSNSTMLVIVGSNGARLVHDEHAPIDLPEGEYRVIRQREFMDGSEVYVRD